MAKAGNIKNMHYDFRTKLNRIDSAQYRDLKVPEVDRKLNEAINLFILLVAFPRVRNQFGFETTQRTVDDIRVLVNDDRNITVKEQKDEYTIYNLPVNYLYFLSANATASRNDCQKQRMDVTVIKHDNRSRSREFYKSDFEWRELNISFQEDGINVYHEGEFTIDKFTLDYIAPHPYVHYAEGFEGGQYTLPDGEVLTGHVDCILPDITHAEIVDLAVLLATGDLELPLANQLRAGQLRVKQLA